MVPVKLAAGAAPAPRRAAPVLTAAQEARQAARLAQAMPALAAAYEVALGRWLGDPVLRRLPQGGPRPIVTESYRSAERQNELYAQGRSKPGPVVTFKRGGESRHNVLPSRAVDVAFLLADGSVSWSGLLLSKFARLVKAADARVRWGGDFPGDFKDGPHFEV